MYNFIKSYGAGVSFVELRTFPEFEGDGEYGLIDQNIIFWTGISEEFVAVLGDLIKEKRIMIVPTSPLVYVMDGTALR